MPTSRNSTLLSLVASPGLQGNTIHQPSSQRVGEPSTPTRCSHAHHHLFCCPDTVHAAAQRAQPCRPPPQQATRLARVPLRLALIEGIERLVCARSASSKTRGGIRHEHPSQHKRLATAAVASTDAGHARHTNQGRSAPVWSMAAWMEVHAQAQTAAHRHPGICGASERARTTKAHPLNAGGPRCQGEGMQAAKKTYMTCRPPAPADIIKAKAP